MLITISVKKSCLHQNNIVILIFFLQTMKIRETAHPSFSSNSPLFADIQLYRTFKRGRVRMRSLAY